MRMLTIKTILVSISPAMKTQLPGSLLRPQIIVCSWILIALAGCSPSQSEKNAQANASPAQIKAAPGIPATHVGTWKNIELRMNKEAVPVKEGHLLVLTPDGRMIIVVNGQPTEPQERYRIADSHMSYVANGETVPFATAIVEGDTLKLAVDAEFVSPDANPSTVPIVTKVYKRLSRSTDWKTVK